MSEHDRKIRVCCRVRPVGKEATTPLNIRDGYVVHLQPSSAPTSNGAAAREESTARNRRRRRGQWGFTFDDVLEDGCSQEEVYRKCAKEIVQSALAGVHGTIMAYGCTGAGKSYTMIGGEQEQDRMDGEQRGICARSLRDVFREVSRRRKQGTTTTVQMSFVELYNEQLFDLFLSPEMRSSRNQRRFNAFGGNGSDSGVIGKRHTPLYSSLKLMKEAPGSSGTSSKRALELAIYEGRNGCTYIKGLSLLPVASEDEALRMLRAGQLARKVAEHQFNHVSSRSHAILTVHLTTTRTTSSGASENGANNTINRGLQTEEGTQGGGPTAAARGGRGEGYTTSKLNLVDLAGSEKSSVVSSAKAGDAAVLHREGRSINKSLAFLEQVTIALADRTREHIPFRCSKLTHFLKDSLGGNCRTLMIACVWPRPDLLQQSLATMKFAARMRCVKNAPVVNERSWSAEDELSSLRRQVDELKAQLALRDQRAGHEGGVGLAGVTKAALDDTTSAHVLFGELQEGGRDQDQHRSRGGALVGGGYLEEDGPLLAAARHGNSSSAGHGWGFAAPAGNSQGEDEHGAGKNADADASPSERTSERSVNRGESAGTMEGSEEAHGRNEGSTPGLHCHDLGVDFERFKNEKIAGIRINARLRDAKAAVKRGRSLVNDLAGRVNKAKSRIDRAQAQLQQQEEQEGAEEEGVESEGQGEGGEEDGEEANVRRVLVAQLKRRKRDYRRLFALLAEARADLRATQQNKQQALVTLAIEFEKRRKEQSLNHSSNTSTIRSDAGSPGGSSITGPGSFLPQLHPLTTSSNTTRARHDETPPLPLAARCKNLGSGSSGGSGASSEGPDTGGCDGTGSGDGTSVAAMAVVLQ